MKNFASTLTTTGLLIGTMVAAHLVIVSQREPDAPQLKPVAVSALPEAVSTWTDPPARVEQQADVVAPVPAMVQAAVAAETSALSEPRVEAPPTRHLSLDSGKTKRAEQARRTRIAQKARASRIAARTSTPEQTGSTASAQPAAANRIDPIGDILRGLGIGNEG